MVKKITPRSKRFWLFGIDAIAKHCGHNIFTVFGWFQNWLGCPIERVDGILIVEKCALEKWIKSRKIEKPEEIPEPVKIMKPKTKRCKWTGAPRAFYEGRW